jgi:hypothetical protein
LTRPATLQQVLDTFLTAETSLFPQPLRIKGDGVSRKIGPDHTGIIAVANKKIGRSVSPKLTGGHS